MVQMKPARCKACGKPIDRHKYPTGLERPCRVARRKFCCRACWHKVMRAAVALVTEKDK